MDTKDKAVEKTELVIKALSYAQEHNLDIQNIDEVRRILEVIDPENVSEDDIEKFMKLLQGSDILIKKDVERRNNIN